MKKYLIIVSLFLLSCSKETQYGDNYIYTSIYPLKLIIQEIVGSDTFVKFIVPSNVSVHTFEPKVSDIQKLESSKIFFFVSKNFDFWVTKNVTNSIELLPLVPKEKICYIENLTPDPHLWTSPKTIYSIIDTLACILAINYPERKEAFHLNARTFKQRIDSINRVLDSLLTPIKNKPIFLFHPSLLYFIRDFDLLYGGAIEEIPGSEPTPSHIADLIDRIKTSGVSAIFTEPQLNPHTAEVIANHTNVKVYQLDPLGSENIKTYEDFVLSFARTIYEALK